MICGDSELKTFSIFFIGKCFVSPPFPPQNPSNGIQFAHKIHTRDQNGTNKNEIETQTEQKIIM